ncbi:hypothetical protein [Streptomyces sp. NPDC017991]|uniref:hypothetical protein n=1 Tax=Streptomyces sp. NPDC017991 TaxID=3365026 RepID=UPI003792AF8E
MLANQMWKDPKARRIGKWGEQYDFRCPSRDCGHLQLSPLARPVGDVIDWDLLGQRVGDGRPDRKKFTACADATRARIAVGLDERYGPDPYVVMLRNHGARYTPNGPGWAGGAIRLHRRNGPEARLRYDGTE